MGGVLLWSTMLGIAWTVRAETSSPGDQAHALAELAARRNPSLAASGARLRSLEEKIRRSGAWLDPVASVEYSNMPVDAWVLGHHAMSGIQLGLRQTFFFPGKLRLRTMVAEGKARQAQLQLEEQALELRAVVAMTYYKLAMVRQLRAVIVAHIHLLGQLIEAVKVKYEVGQGDQQDLLRLKLLDSRLNDDLNDFDRDDRTLTGALNAALHRPSTQTIATPTRLQPSAPSETVEALTARAERQRPLLRNFVERAKTERAAARAAAREIWPDFTVWFSYRFRNRADGDPGTDFVSLGLSLPIPLSADRRWDSERRAAEDRARAAESDRSAALDGLQGLLAEKLARWRRAAQQQITYRDKIVPQARRVLDATLVAYRVGRADFASLYQAQLQLLDFARTICLAEVAAALARVETSALVGDSI